MLDVRRMLCSEFDALPDAERQRYHFIAQNRGKTDLGLPGEPEPLDFRKLLIQTIMPFYIFPWAFVYLFYRMHTAWLLEEILLTMWRYETEAT